MIVAVPPAKQRELIMYRLQMESCLLLGALLLAGCSDRNISTAPSVGPLAAITTVDRPYTWSVECSGDWPGSSYANWSWTDASGAPIGTAGLSGCLPGQTLSGSGVRPAAATGFSACVNWDNCPHTWSFDPAGPFKAQLKGSSPKTWECYPSFGSRKGHCGWVTETATLNVDS